MGHNTQQPFKKSEILYVLELLGSICANANGVCEECPLWSNRQHGCFLKGEHALLLHKGSSLETDLINLKESDE